MSRAGAWYEGGVCQFTVWAPEHKKMVLHVVYPHDRLYEMARSESGYFELSLESLPSGSKYFYRPGGVNDYPDPASFYQPDGVHGPSAIVNHQAYAWKDGDWRGIPFQDLVLYELHTGTFTPEGTFEAIIPRLDELKETGINGIELMPVAQFPGERNWGYDGVYPYAVQASYGGPMGLKRLVDACHEKGIAVFLDVVYNHLGPEGNYLSCFGPYFTDRYTTPWGDAINYDGEWSDGVKDYIAGNACYWLEHYHIDGLRLDAIHTVFDHEATSIWDIIHRRTRELSRRVGRPFYLIAESDYNSPKVVKHPELGGLGFDAQWLDDFHHALYVLLDAKGRNRYIDFGSLGHLAKAYTEGFVHSGEYVQFRKRRHGASSGGIPGDRFVVFNQNHDQVGNRVGGERLCMLVDAERQKMAAAALLLSPYIPMLFMGEEYADDSPFFYFVSHSDEELVQAVREGRKKEFEAYSKGEDMPDPQGAGTFRDSGLQWEKRYEGRHALMLRWHQRLIQMRRSEPALRNYCKSGVRADVVEEKGLVLHRQSEDGRQHMLCMFNFSEEAMAYTLPAGEWNKVLDSAEWEREQEASAPVSGGAVVSVGGVRIVVYGEGA